MDALANLLRETGRAMLQGMPVVYAEVTDDVGRWGVGPRWITEEYPGDYEAATDAELDEWYSDLAHSTLDPAAFVVRVDAMVNGRRVAATMVVTAETATDIPECVAKILREDAAASFARLAADTA